MRNINFFIITFIENKIESTENTDSSSSYYDSDDESIDSEEEEYINDSNVSLDDIENDDFRSIYEWANKLSYENTINNALSDIKI